MKINEKPKPKKGKIIKRNGVYKEKPKKDKVLVVAQEIKYARLLCSNGKQTRERVLKPLKKWLTACFEKNYEFKEDDFMRVWKGFFYAVWMADKPLIQEELCENISSVLDIFPPEQLSAALLLVKAGFKTLATEWYGIDHHRMDKFLMLVRRYLRGSLRVLQRCGWSEESCSQFARVLSGADGVLALNTPHYARNALSMILHLMDCYLEEIAKVSDGNIGGEALALLLYPVVCCISSSSSPALVVSARRVLTTLLRQSETELNMREKIHAWQKMGCPEGGPNALETDDEESDDEQTVEKNENSTKVLDPRAGRVDVELPLLPVPGELLAKMLREMLTKVGGHAYRRVLICAQRFERLAKGESAFPPPAAPLSGGSKRKKTIKKMMRFEQKIVENSDELRLKALSRKHRKGLLRKTRAGLSIIEDVEKINTQTNKYSNGDWKIETLHDENKNTSDKENDIKKTKTTKKRKTEEDPPVLKKQRIELKNNKKEIDKEKRKDKVTKDKVKLNTDKVLNKSNNNKQKLVNSDNKTKIETTKEPSQNGIIKEKRNKSKEDKIKTDIQKDKSQKDTSLKDISQKDKSQKDKSQKDNRPTKKYSFVFNNNKNNSNMKSRKTMKPMYDTPKKVKFVLQNNSMQKPIDYYKSVRQSPNIPFDSRKKPIKTNLKPCAPSPINPFFKKILKVKVVYDKDKNCFS